MTRLNARKNNFKVVRQQILALAQEREDYEDMLQLPGLDDSQRANLRKRIKQLSAQIYALSAK